MEYLYSQFGVRHECFASPLNRNFDVPRFSSLFPDTDRFFGSTGSFFQLPLDSGSYEVNPPFDWYSVVQCIDRIGEVPLHVARCRTPLCCSCMCTRRTAVAKCASHFTLP